MNVVEALGEIAQQFPNGIGLKVPYRSRDKALQYRDKTFAQMDHSVDLWATFFLEKKFCRGKKVLLLLPPGEDLLIAVFALLRLGAIPVVIDPGMGLKNFIRCVRKVQPDCFLGCQRARWIYHLLRPFFRVSQTLFLTQRLKKKLEQQSLVCHLQPETDRLTKTAAVLFTSGSTGYPKGALYTYQELNAQIEALVKTFHITPGEIDLPLLPVFSLYNPALGMTTVVPEMDPAHPSAFDTPKIVEAFLQCSVTNCFGSPRLWTKIVDYCEAHSIVFPALKRAFLAGAPVHPLLLKRVQALLPHGTALTPYGATEALPIAYISAQEVLEKTYKRTLEGHGTCLGHLLEGVSVRIIPIFEGSLEALPKALSAGEIGEITVSAPYISKGYLNDASATAKAKIKDGNTWWHRMGDVGYLDEDGKLWFCGRRVERVICRKQIFYTDCCEAVFNAHPAVFRCALIGFQDKGETVPAMVIETKVKLKKREKMELLQDLRTLGWKHAATAPITHFCFYKKFPVDVRHNAKIHRLTLREYFAKHPRLVHNLHG